MMVTKISEAASNTHILVKLCSATPSGSDRVRRERLGAGGG
jgi:hypothetical protein